MVESLAQRQWYFGAHRIGIRVRAALMALTYKKSLTVKHGSVSTGKVINFLNVDVERIGDFFMFIHWIWLLPFQIIFALLILYMNLGAAPSAAAFVATIVVMVSNIPFARRQKQLQTKIMEAKDSRIKATSEILKNMKILKLHSWETAFFNKLLKLRETEKGWLRKYLYTCSAVAFLFWASPTLVSVVTFGVCVVTNTPLTAGTVLSALATFRILQEPIYNLPELISTVVQTKVSVKRMQEFIGEEDQQKLTSYHASDTSEVALERLLCSIMGEIPKVSGSSIKSYGSKALVAQTALISCLREIRKRQKLEELNGKYTPYFSLLHIKDILLPLSFCATSSSKGCKLQAITGLHGEQKQKAGCPERNCSGYLSCYLGEAPSLSWEGQFCFQPLQSRLLSSSLFRWPNQSFEHLCHSLTPHLQAEFSIGFVHTQLHKISFSAFLLISEVQIKF
nr:putative ABC transporter C family member 15 [Ipomoea batatas]GME04244.1 putative ABC transporter C family member 15 [Ipomoea batatas]GME17384.1 putative ABC transporter C family member 15 [Ipomoea batatas]